MDIGKEKETVIVEPAEDPFRRPAEQPTEKPVEPEREVEPA
jgi:hypothetical protein